MATLSVAIMAHQDRAEMVDELQIELGPEHVPVAMDTKPASRSPQQRWNNGRRAWELCHPEADWHMVIQDDALPVPGLLDALRTALDYVPDSAIVSPYIGTKRPAVRRWDRLVREADEEDGSWIVTSALMWGVAIIAPVDTIPDMLGWCDKQSAMPYDMRVGRYYKQKLKWPTWYTWPSLVDHRDGVSLVGHGQSGRNARRLPNDRADTLGWDGKVITGRQPDRAAQPPRSRPKRR